MIVKILGGLDILAGICFWLFGIFNIIPENFILLLGLFLLAKGVIFCLTLNFFSILDIISAGIIIAASASEIVMPQIIVIGVTLFLVLKGILSM